MEHLLQAGAVSERCLGFRGCSWVQNVSGYPGEPQCPGSHPAEPSLCNREQGGAGWGSLSLPKEQRELQIGGEGPGLAGTAAARGSRAAPPASARSAGAVRRV